MTEECKRQTNELFYNVMHNHTDLMKADLTELLAMQSGLDHIIEEKKQEEFQARVKQIKTMMEKFKKDYPSASWYVVVETSEGLNDEIDLFDHMDYHCIEP